MPKQTAFLNKEINEAKMAINDSRNNKVTQRIITLSDGDDEKNNYAMKNSKSMASVESDDDDDDKNDLESHCSVQAVVSYSDSSISLTKENKEVDDDDDTQRSESTDDEFNDLQKRTRSIHSEIIKSLSHSSGRVVGDETPYIHSRNTGRRRGDVDGNKGVENVVDNGGDDDDDDILQKWRRRRRLEKLKMEHNRKLQETTQFHELEKLNDVLTTNPDTPLHNLPPFHVKSSAQHHHQQQHSLHHEQVAQHQQQQHQLGFHETFSKENNQTLSKHPLKIHFCNVSRCCGCCHNFSYRLEQKKKELPLASERCRLGGGDGVPKPHDHDQPTRDAGVCRSLISQPARSHLHQHHHHRCKNSKNNIHAKALPSQSKNIIRPASMLEDKLPMTMSVDDTGDKGRALTSSSGHIAGGRSDKKVVEVQGGVANGICNPDKETRGFRDQSTITDERSKDEKESRLKNNESKKIYQRRRLPEIDSRKTVSMPNDDSKPLKDFDPLTCSFTTVSSLETNADGDGGDCDDVATTSHHTRRHSTFPNSKPQSENLDSDERPDGVDNSTRLHRTPFKLKEVHGKHLDDDGDGGVCNKEKVGSKKDLNTCINEVISIDSHSDSDFADIESLLEVSDGKEFSEDEILKDLRERRKRCLRRIKHLNELLPP